MFNLKGGFFSAIAVMLALAPESSHASESSFVKVGSTCYCCESTCSTSITINYDCNSISTVSSGTVMTGYPDGSSISGTYQCIDMYSEWQKCDSCGSSYVASGSVSHGYCLNSETGDICSGCNYGTCGSTITHCGQGYYKSGNTCPECPDKALGAITSGLTSNGITACYMPANITLTDTYGSYLFASNCAYTN